METQTLISIGFHYAQYQAFRTQAKIEADKNPTSAAGVPWSQAS